MDRREERDLLVAQLAGYLEDLRDTGVDELYYAHDVPQASSPESFVPVPLSAAAASPPSAAVAAPDAAAATVTAPPVNAANESPVVRQPDAPRNEPAPFRGFGNPQARIVFILTGNGFHGEAGELLARIIEAIGLKKDDVYLICFDALAPVGAELRDSVRSAIKAARPEVVVAMGDAALHLLLQKAVPVSTLRGRFLKLGGMALMPTLHPEELVRDAALKKPVWEDMQQVRQRLGHRP